tara:strand:- start:269 stop:1216 length:948 start_codon:yes stop_codon:yes gene_type:complete
MEKRNIKEILVEIESVSTIDVDIALSCFYVLFNDNGQPFVGISVRFAEIIASCWGNIDTGAKVVSNDGKILTVMGFVNDLQKNSRFSVQIQRKIIDYKGFALSQEKVVEITNAVSSIAFRNAIFKAIPAAIFTTVVKKIKKFITETADNGLIVNEALLFFAKKNILEKDIKEKLEVDTLKSLDSEKTFLLIGLKNAVNEGDITVQQAFGINNKSENTVRPSKFQFGEDSLDSDSEMNIIVIPTKDEVVSILDDKEGMKPILSAINQPINNKEIKEEFIDTNNNKERSIVYDRPRGRTPKGKEWDNKKGEFVLIEI